MKENAITMNPEGYSEALNAMSIMFGWVTAIQYPKEYNFMSYIIPDEIKNYVTLEPSQHLKDVSPQFFDLTFNNVIEIKDALEGDYYYVLTVKEDFPEEYKGKLWEIKMKLNEEYFETLPGVKDPTDVNKVHDYHITIPSIKFGVPLSTGEYKGKVFYNLGQAKDLYFTYKVHKHFEFQGIKIVTDDDINHLSEAIENEENRFINLLNVWNSIEDSEISKKIKVTNETIANDNFYQLVKVDLSEAFPLFPYEVKQNPFVTNISLLVKTFADFVPYGYRNHLIEGRVYYNNGRRVKNTRTEEPRYINCLASGPSLAATFNNKVVELNETSSSFYETNIQTIFNGDTKFVKLIIKITNEGTSPAYSPKFSLGIDPKAVYIPNKEEGNSLSYSDEGVQGDTKRLIVNYDRQIGQGDNLKFDLYFEVEFGEKTEVQFDITERNLQGNSNQKLTLVKSLNITLCLSEAECHEGDPNFGRERTDASHKISYKNEQRAVGKIVLKTENIGTDLMPKYKLTAEIQGVMPGYDKNNVMYSFRRKIEGVDERFIQIALTTDNSIIDIPFEEGEIKEKGQYNITYKVIGEFPDGRTLDSINDNEVNFVYALDEEIEEEKKGFPSYAIAIIIIVGLGVILTGAFLVYKFFLKNKKNNIGKENEIQSPSQQNVNELNQKSSERDIKNSVKVINFEENK